MVIGLPKVIPVISSVSALCATILVAVKLARLVQAIYIYRLRESPTVFGADV